MSRRGSRSIFLSPVPSYIFTLALGRERVVDAFRVPHYWGGGGSEFPIIGAEGPLSSPVLGRRGL